MPTGTWTATQERKYEHIKTSARRRGASARRAKEIAARTIQKERAQKGRSKTASRTSVRDLPSSTRGGKRSGRAGARGRTRDQLYNEAKRLGIRRRSTMSKDQLRRAVDASKR